MFVIKCRKTGLFVACYRSGTDRTMFLSKARKYGTRREAEQDCEPTQFVVVSLYEHIQSAIAARSNAHESKGNIEDGWFKSA